MKNVLKGLLLFLSLLTISSNTFASFVYEKNIDNLNNTDLESYSYNINNLTDVATPYIKDMSMIQDDNNYYIDYDIIFEKQDFTFDLNNTLISDEIDEAYNVNNKVESFGGSIILTEVNDKDISLNTKVKRDNNTYNYSGSASSNNENTDYNIIYTKDNTGSNMITYDVKLPMTKSTLGVNLKSDIIDVYKNQTLKDFSNRLYGKMFYKSTASITCNTTMLDNSHFKYKYKGTIIIPKQSKDKYKYLQLISPKALKTNIVYNKTSNGVNLVETYKGIKSISIDISNMFVCGANYKENVFHNGNSNHNWTYTNNANTKTHEKYCNKCKWMARENHNLDYEYNGFTHNACKCGYISKVNVSYLVDGEFQYKKIYNSFSKLDKPILDIPSNKTISYYVKTELQYENEDNIDFSETKTPIKEVVVGNVNQINDVTGLYSVIYNAITTNIVIKEEKEIVLKSSGGGSSGENLVNVFGLPNEEEASPSEIIFTENFSVNKGYEEYKFVDHGSTTVNTYQEYALNNFTIKDSEQNPATLSEIKKFKMRQDNNNYYFDFDLVYENRFLKVNDVLKIGDCQLYVSSTNNDSLNYEYTAYANGKSYYTSQGRGYSGWSQSNQSTSTPAVQYQSLTMKINGKMGTQTMTNTQTNTNSIPYTCTYAPSENVSQNQVVYSSLVFPFERFLGNGKTAYSNYYLNSISDYYIYLGNYNCYIPYQGGDNGCSTAVMASTTGQILFTNSQSNKIMPIKPTYNMVNITSQSSDYSKDYWNKELKGTITIKKEDIDKYKYINLYAPEGYIVNKNFNDVHEGITYRRTTNEYINGFRTSSSNPGIVFSCPAKAESAMSIHSTSNGSVFGLIDLDNLSHCEHEWQLSYCDDTKHVMKCKKCEWEKDENHNYQYEYDDIDNDMCECGKVLHIKNHYIYNSDIVNNIVEEYNPNVEIATKNEPTKTGYMFRNYSVYYKILNRITATGSIIEERYINDVTSLPIRTASYSTIFKTNYDPIKYKFKFSKENNLNLVSTYSELPLQEFNYDEEKAISDCINIDNYFFTGWSLATNSEIIITPKQLIKNYTATNNQEIILYPNYEPLKFTINYKTDKCNFSNGTLNITKNYDLSLNNSSLEMPILSSKVVRQDTGKYTHDIYTTTYNFIEYVDEFGNKFKNINDVINYIKHNSLTNNLILSFNAIINESTTKQSKESGGGGTGGADPTGGLYKKEAEKLAKESDLTELFNNLDMFIEPQYVSYVKKAIEKKPELVKEIEKDIKIYGFTLTLEDIKEKLTKEEIKEIEEEQKNSHYIVVSSMTDKEKFSMFAKDNKGLFIIISIILILLIVVVILWYFDKLPFLRRYR